MFFSELHAIYIEASLEIMIASYFTIVVGETSPLGEGLSFILAAFSAFVYLILLPIQFFIVWIHAMGLIEISEGKL